MRSDLPLFTIKYAADRTEHDAENALINSSGLCIRTRNFNIPKKVFENEDSIVCILGHPIWENKIDYDSVRNLVRDVVVDSRFLGEINGEFVIFFVDKKRKTLCIMNDRFASIPLYYAIVGNVFVASVFYNDLWAWLRESGKLSVNRYAFFEFLWLQRILGTKTYDTLSRFMPAASWLTYDFTRTEVESYWGPSFTKTQESLKDCSIRLAHCLRESVRRKTSDGEKRHGIFLSGGTDSRTVLSVFGSVPVCFTIAVGKNNEYRVAKEVADVRGARHIFIELDPDPYSDHLDDLVKLGGGMYAFDHALFFGFRNIVADYADIVFHGHGIDYMFQGMYVPKKQICIGRKHTYFYRLRTLCEDFVSDFLSSISYRLKDADLYEFVKADYRDEMKEYLRESVKEIMRNGEKYCNTPFDQWEYMLMHALSRHYPNTNLSSMATCTEQRTITFDNDVFDLYLSLPAKYRLNARIAKMTLKYVNPGMARIRTGNTNIRADITPFRMQVSRAIDCALVRTGLRKRSVFWAPAEERTWPDRDSIVRNQPRMKQATLDLCNSEALDSLKFIDMDALSREIPKWLEQPTGGGAFMTFLITIDRFLRQ